MESGVAVLPLRASERVSRSGEKNGLGKLQDGKEWFSLRVRLHGTFSSGGQVPSPELETEPKAFINLPLGANAEVCVFEEGWLGSYATFKHNMFSVCE